MNLAVLCRRAEKLLALKPVPGCRYQHHACKISANTTKDEKGLVFWENSHLKVEIGRFSRSGARLWGPLARPGGDPQSHTYKAGLCSPCQRRNKFLASEIINAEFCSFSR
jgi:hypothetical protein